MFKKKRGRVGFSHALNLLSTLSTSAQREHPDRRGDIQNMAAHRTAECGQTNRDTTKSLVRGGRMRLILVEAGLATGWREFKHVLGRG